MNHEFRIAVVTTAFTPFSHADVIVRRWLDPLPTDGEFEWPGPRTRITSLHVMQIGPKDQSVYVASKFGLPTFDSIEGALTLGGEKLAVDAVMLIGEHGDYPFNELQQKLYPRKEMLDAVLDVMESSGRVVPLYFDKHLSWSPELATAMLRRLETLKVPWFGGSSLPYCPMLPKPASVEGKILREAVITTWGDMESYLFHGLEVLESLLEKTNRSGDLHTIRAWKNEEAWLAMDRGEFSMVLLDTAVRTGASDFVPAYEQWLDGHTAPVEIFQLRYSDGFRTTLVRLHPVLRKWAWAVHVEGEMEPIAAAPLAHGEKPYFFGQFARLSRRIEDFFLTKIPPVPKSRIIRSTFATALCMQALANPGKDIAVSLPDFYPNPLPESSPCQHTPASH